MNLVVLGLSLSSSWGNGHATTFRALLKAFAARGHAVTFLERDVPWYAEHRDMAEPDFCRLELYGDTADLQRFAPEVAAADAVMVGSYVPDGVAVGAWAQATARGPVAFYDIDTPVTLAKLERGDHEYLTPELIPGYAVYLSFTGGPTLRRIERQYGSPAARALYCSVDAQAYHPIDTGETRWNMTYLGTYSPDRQPTVERLLVEPARRAPHLRFAVAGPQYPADIDWPANVERFEHVPPHDHAEFYALSGHALNVTRADMIVAGWSPSVRLFEAAACATPVISDLWDGLDQLFEPGREIVLTESADEVLSVLTDPDPRRAKARGEAARARVLAQHTSAHRAAELERWLDEALAVAPAGARASAPEGRRRAEAVS